MHNIDRTLQELESGPLLTGEYENGYEYSAQGEYGQEMEFGQEFGQEYSGEFGQEYSQEFEASQGENLELEMAYQLLEVSNEQELNQFLGGLMSRAAGAVGGAASRFVGSPAGRSVGQYLVNFGKKTLPQLASQYGGQAGGSVGGKVGSALGGRFGATGAKLGNWAGQKAGSWAGQKAGGWAGTQAGNWVADNAQRIFNLELETLSPENQELEIARSYVRFATDVTRRAQQAVRQNPGLSLGELGQQVLSASVPKLAPGLLTQGAKPAAAGSANGRARVAASPAGAGPNGRPRPTSGTWIRRGNAIVLRNA
ncbi:hypothetical protein [Hymenobacter elongatus]|uniref:Uncharacterized protein n=1 Tax=Hymenobacter elongatus TaxID=877208 RepID=A0A4Z0PQQ9_9BACT|nr:hypothetical protein [Hymenobacter elongatus]TGE20057.1 hypothetical protein E5J99_00370 [Hymenobacter elongatus]